MPLKGKWTHPNDNDGKIHLQIWVKFVYIDLLEFIYAFLKVLMFGLCGYMWWKKPKNPGKTTNLGQLTTPLPHTLTWIQTRTAERTMGVITSTLPMLQFYFEVHLNFYRLYW